MKKCTLFSLVLSFGLIMGCSDSDSSSDSLKGKKCTENETIKCKSADTPNLAYLCINGKWTDADLSNVADIEADVCVVIDGKDVEMPECPADSEGSHATFLPHIDPVCAVAECAKDSRGVLYTKEYSLVCKDGGGEVSGNTCVCGTEDE